MKKLIQKLPDMFDDYTIHPSGAIRVSIGEYHAVITQQPDMPGRIVVKYFHNGDQDPRATVAGLEKDAISTLKIWRKAQGNER